MQTTMTQRLWCNNGQWQNITTAMIAYSTKNWMSLRRLPNILEEAQFWTRRVQHRQKEDMRQEARAEAKTSRRNPSISGSSKSTLLIQGTIGWMLIRVAEARATSLGSHGGRAQPVAGAPTNAVPKRARQSTRGASINNRSRSTTNSLVRKLIIQPILASKLLLSKQSKQAQARQEEASHQQRRSDQFQDQKMQLKDLGRNSKLSLSRLMDWAANKSARLIVSPAFWIMSEAANHQLVETSVQVRRERPQQRREATPRNWRLVRPANSTVSTREGQGQRIGRGAKKLWIDHYLDRNASKTKQHISVTHR